MSPTTRLRELSSRGAILVGIAVAAVASVSAVAQIPPPPIDPNQRQVYLDRLDQSDCTNSNVPNTDGPTVSGNIWVTRESNGTTTLKIAMTASPSTAYNFFLKCVRQLTTITTDDEGVANVTISFPTNAAGNVYAFDMYPNGAPAGNKFQSAQVKF